MGWLYKQNKTVLLITLMLVVASAVSIAFIAPARRQAWKDAHPLSDPQVGFQMYAPTELPGGFKITGKRISVHTANFYDKENGNPHKPESVMLEMNLREGNWVYSITERRAVDNDKAEINVAVNNYDPTSVRASCTRRTSPKYRQYRLCHWLDYGRISVYEVKFIKNGTYIDTTFPTSKDRILDETELDAYVDSFKKASPDGLPMLVDAV